jgi:hypothetical protein
VIRRLCQVWRCVALPLQHMALRGEETSTCDAGAGSCAVRSSGAIPARPNRERLAIGGLALTNRQNSPRSPAPKIAKLDGSGTGGGGSGGGGPDIRWGDRRSLAVLGGYATPRRCLTPPDTPNRIPGFWVGEHGFSPPSTAPRLRRFPRWSFWGGWRAEAMQISQV